MYSVLQQLRMLAPFTFSLEKGFLRYCSRCKTASLTAVSWLGLVGIATLVHVNPAWGQGVTASESTPADATDLASLSSLETSILQDFADRVILPSYAHLAVTTTDLTATTTQLAADPTEANLATAQSAWREALLAWRRGTAYTFGPSDSLGFGGNLESGLDEAGITEFLNGNTSITPTTIAALPSSLRGFEAIAYVLFGNDNSRSIDQLSARELTYLQALAIDLQTTAQDLSESWATGVEGYSAYRQVFVTAGDSNNPAYLSGQAALEEIAQGILGTTDEIVAEEIPGIIAILTEAAEPPVGGNSLANIHSTTEGAYYAYVGGVPEASRLGKGLADYVAANDPDVDADIQTQFQIALEALQQADGDPGTLVTAAIALDQVMDQLQQEVLPLLQTP
ncbi:MAG: imelysin family protein [Cyanobacteria bacterium J06639_14]